MSKVPPFCRLPLAVAYRLGFSFCKRIFYRKKAPLNGARVVIVGSFLSGGAGKTPLVLKLAENFLAKGLRVAVLCHAAAWDECEMLRELCPGAEVFLTRNRYALAKKLALAFDVILSDGGLADTRFSGAKVLALRWGERAAGIRDLIPSGSCTILEKDCPEARPVFCFRKASLSGAELPPGLSAAFGISQIANCSGKTLPAGEKVSLVTAIGNPERFLEDVKSLGLSVSRKIFLPDHSRSYEKTIRRELSRGLPIVLSEKDFARLCPDLKQDPRLYTAKMQVDVSQELLDFSQSAVGFSPNIV